MLTSEVLQHRSNQLEVGRVKFETLSKPVSVDELQRAVMNASGPRIVILNTIQNAAIVANNFLKSGKFDEVFHLSTALSPADRDSTLDSVRRKLQSSKDGNWVLVGTSCIEAGVDLDFASGFREISSLTSLLQTSGRVNRSATRKCSQVFSFDFDLSEGMNVNPLLEDASRILRGFLNQKIAISASLCTEALKRELQLNPIVESLLNRIVNEERRLRFPEVERMFKIITADSRTVIVNRDIIRRIESFEYVDWREIQRHSVQIWGYKIDKLHIPELNNHSGVYAWHLDYSPFIGVMEGILALSEFERNGGSVI
jgi:CRISPR/Cas system-associated endonuclease/helicase Cas3